MGGVSCQVSLREGGLGIREGSLVRQTESIGSRKKQVAVEKEKELEKIAEMMQSALEL